MVCKYCSDNLDGVSPIGFNVVDMYEGELDESQLKELLDDGREIVLTAAAEGEGMLELWIDDDEDATSSTVISFPASFCPWCGDAL